MARLETSWEMAEGVGWVRGVVEWSLEPMAQVLVMLYLRCCY